MANLIEVNESNFKQEVLDQQIPVLVDFFANWCGPCKMMNPVLESISLKLDSKIKVVKLDTDKNQALAIQYQITGIPCLIVFKDGKEFKRIVGFQSEDSLVSQLTNVI